MKEMFCLRAADVSYWDGYSIWYQLWFEHNNYHDGVLETLTERVAPVETESSFAYHSVSEAIEHWAYKHGRYPVPREEREIRSKLIWKRSHFWMNGMASTNMYWWALCA